MRRCTRCRLSPRKNDPMYAVQIYEMDHGLRAEGWPVGGYDVCHDCASEGFQGLALPAVPDFMPEGWGNYWCPLCRQFMRENDSAAHDNRCLRLTEEDVEGTQHKPGAVRCCSECWEKWAPIVVERWQREGLLLPGTPWQFAGLNLV